MKFLSPAAFHGKDSHPPLQRGLLLAIVALAFSLRVWNLDFGFPYNLAPDEKEMLRDGRQLFERNLYPVEWRRPTFTALSLAFLGAGYRTVKEWVQERFHIVLGDEDARLSIYYLGRLWIAILGTATVGLTYSIGRNLYGSAVGLMAAFLLATVPLHGVMSHYLKEDIPFTFWITAFFLSALNLIQKNRGSTYFWMGFFAGAATSNKYNGILTLPVMVLAHFMGKAGRSKIQDPRSKTPLRSSIRYLRSNLLGPLSSMLAFCLGFALFTPVVLKDPNFVLNGFLYQIRYGSSKHHDGIAISAWDHAWMYYFKTGIVPGLTLPIAILAVLGIGFICFLRRRDDPAGPSYLLAGWILYFYLSMEYGKAKPAPFSARYILPIVPFLCVTAAYCFNWISVQIQEGKWERWKRWAIRLVQLSLLIVPLSSTIQYDHSMKPDTRLQAKDWIEANIPKGALIVLDKAKYYYLPPLEEADYKILDMPQLKQPELLQKKSFLITSSFVYNRFLENPQAVPEKFNLYAQIPEKYLLVKEFPPPYKTYGFNNPLIQIYKVGNEG